MVRVAGLLELDEAGLGVRSVDGLTPSQALAAIRESVVALTGRQAWPWRRELRPSLAAAGVEIARIEDCTDKELRRLQAYFEREIFPVLTPLAVGPGSRSRTSPGSRCRSGCSRPTRRRARSASPA